MKPNHRKLATLLEQDADDPKHRPSHRAKLQRAAARERDLAREQDELDVRPQYGYYSRRRYG